MKAMTAIFTKCISGQDSERVDARVALPPSHLRKRRRSAARRAVQADAQADAQAPRLTSARPTTIEVQLLDEVLLHDPDGAYRNGRVPRVLHIDSDIKSATVLAALLMPEAQVTHVPTLADARRLLATHIYSLVVMDPQLSDGDAVVLLPALASTPLLVYANRHPDWREPLAAFLPKPWTTPRQLWSTISSMLGMAGSATAGD